MSKESFISELKRSKYYIIGIITALFSLILHLFLTHVFELERTIELKDLLTIAINILFLLIISKSITKAYDSDRKKKDIFIDEIRSYLEKVNNFYFELKSSNYSRKSAVNSITELRDEAESLKSLIGDNFHIDVGNTFSVVQKMLRSTDRIINPSEHFNEFINNEQTTLINSYKLHIREALYEAMTAVNKR